MPWVATSVNIAKHLTVVLWEVESIKCTASFPCQLPSTIDDLIPMSTPQ